MDEKLKEALQILRSLLEQNMALGNFKTVADFDKVRHALNYVENALKPANEKSD